MSTRKGVERGFYTQDYTSLKLLLSDLFTHYPSVRTMATLEPQETLEYRIFREHYDRLVHSIQDPLPLAVRLFSKGVIKSAVKDHMSVLGLSTLEKNNALLSAVEKHIQLDPQKINVFLSALNEESSLQSLVESMQSKFFLCEDIMAFPH